MRVLVSYGMHRNEYTEPTALLVAERLRGYGHDVIEHKIPFAMTGWGKAMAGKYTEINMSLNDGSTFWPMHFEETLGTHVIRDCIESGQELTPEEFEGKSALGSFAVLDFHTADWRVLNPGELPAEKLRFRYGYVASEGDAMLFMWGGNLCDAQRNIYSLELPQVYRRASNGFLRLVQRKLKTRIDFDDEYGLASSTLKSYFRDVPDKPATLKKYPPEILARIIAEGAQEQILSGEFLRRMDANQPELRLSD